MSIFGALLVWRMWVCFPQTELPLISIKKWVGDNITVSEAEISGGEAERGEVKLSHHKSKIQLTLDILSTEGILTKNKNNRICHMNDKILQNQKQRGQVRELCPPVFSTDETSSWILCSVLGSSLLEGYWVPQACTEKSNKAGEENGKWDFWRAAGVV